MNKQTEKQYCPICNAEVPPILRYPKYLCQNCSEKVVSPDGRRIEFYNDEINGFTAFYVGSDEKYNSHTCFVENSKCYAEKSYLGGTIIQTILIFPK